MSGTAPTCSCGPSSDWRALAEFLEDPMQALRTLMNVIEGRRVADPQVALPGRAVFRAAANRHAFRQQQFRQLGGADGRGEFEADIEVEGAFGQDRLASRRPGKPLDQGPA